MNKVWITVIAAVCWGLAANSGEYLIGQKHMEAVQLTCIRLIAAGAILLVFAAVKHSDILSIWKQRRDRIELLITGFIGFGACQAAYFLAIRFSNSGTACVIQNMAPIFILVCTLFMEKRGPRTVEIISIAVVLAGAFLLTTHGNLGSLAISPAGLLMGLISAAAVALYSILPARLMDKFGSLVTTGWSILLGGLILLPFGGLGPLHGNMDGGAWAMLLFLILVGTVTTFGLYMWSLPYVGAFTASVVCLLEPVVASFVTVAIFGTPFMWADYAGIAGVLAGLLILTVLGGRHGE